MKPPTILSRLRLKEIPGIAAYRYEKRDVPDTLYNDAMLNGLNSGQYYFSVAPYGGKRLL